MVPLSKIIHLPQQINRPWREISTLFLALHQYSIKTPEGILLLVFWLYDKAASFTNHLLSQGLKVETIVFYLHTQIDAYNHMHTL